jgi:hypothetical protein
MPQNKKGTYHRWIEMTLITKKCWNLKGQVSQKPSHATDPLRGRTDDLLNKEPNETFSLINISSNNGQLPGRRTRSWLDR